MGSSQDVTKLPPFLWPPPPTKVKQLKSFLSMVSQVIHLPLCPHGRKTVRPHQAGFTVARRHAVPHTPLPPSASCRTTSPRPSIEPFPQRRVSSTSTWTGHWETSRRMVALGHTSCKRTSKVSSKQLGLPAGSSRSMRKTIQPSFWNCKWQCSA